MPCRIDNVADRHPFIADMTVMIVDHAKAAVGLGICRGPEPIVGRRTTCEPAHGTLGLDQLSCSPSLTTVPRSPRNLPMTAPFGDRPMPDVLPECRRALLVESVHNAPFTIEPGAARDGLAAMRVVID